MRERCKRYACMSVCRRDQMKRFDPGEEILLFLCLIKNWLNVRNSQGQTCYFYDKFQVQIIINWRTMLLIKDKKGIHSTLLTPFSNLSLCVYLLLVKALVVSQCSGVHTQQNVVLPLKRVSAWRKRNLTEALYATVFLRCIADQTALIAPLNQSNGSTIRTASASKRQLSGYRSSALSFLLQTHVRKSAEWWNRAGYWSLWSLTLTSAALIGQKGRVGLCMRSLFQCRSGVLSSTESQGGGYQYWPSNWLPFLW